MLLNNKKEEVNKCIEEKVNKIINEIVKDSGKNLSEDEIKTLKNHITSLMLIDEKFDQIIDLENLDDIEDILYDVNNNENYKDTTRKKFNKLLKILKNGLVDFILMSALLATVAVWIPGFSITPNYIVFQLAFILVIVDYVLKKYFLKLLIPLLIFTFGTFYFVVWSLELYLLSCIFGDMFVVNSFYVALVASIIIHAFKFLIEFFLLKKPMKYKFIIKL